MNRWIKSSVVITMLLALVTLGFHNHHAERHTHPLDGAALAFVAAGGPLSDICQEGSDDPDMVTACPVCTLAGVFHTPADKTACCEAPQSYETVASLPCHTSSVPTRLDYAHASRAPLVI